MPDRKDIIWINCSPQVGQEMQNIHPFLVLSPKAFNDVTSIVIGLPMTTAEYNSDNPFAVQVGLIKSSKSKKSYVLCHQPKSFDWLTRGAKPHPLKTLSDDLFEKVSKCLHQIIF